MSGGSYSLCWNTSNNLLANDHFGFHARQSSVMPLLLAIHQCHKKASVLPLWFFDFRKAFGWMSPTRLSWTDILASKFQPLLFAGSPTTCMCPTTTKKLEFLPPYFLWIFGVTKGSIPGPLSFLIYLNNLRSTHFPLALRSCWMLMTCYFITPSQAHKIWPPLRMILIWILI